MGDGECDSDNNIAACEYDGGDCCESTCVDALWSCGISGYDCVDPEAPVPPAPDIGEECTMSDGWSSGIYDCDLVCVSSGWSAPTTGDASCDAGRVGDDANFNCEPFDYDGGDCCETTCEPVWSTDCDGFDACMDPAAPVPTVGEDCFGYGSWSGFTGKYDCNLNCIDTSSWSAPEPGDGDCDSESGDSDEADFNCEYFGYDEGDCCATTCTPTFSSDCGEFDACVDPSAPPAVPGAACSLTSGTGILDCLLDCETESRVTDYLDDEICDDGTYGVDLNCAEFEFDSGYCSTDEDSGSWPYMVLFPETPA